MKTKLEKIKKALIKLKECKRVSADQSRLDKLKSITDKSIRKFGAQDTIKIISQMCFSAYDKELLDLYLESEGIKVQCKLNTKCFVYISDEFYRLIGEWGPIDFHIAINKFINSLIDGEII